MAYIDKYGVEFSVDRKTLVKCPDDFQGEYIIPDGVTIISSEAFMGCEGLTNISIPNSVVQIGRWAFAACTGLKSIEIPNRVRWIDDSTFFGCSDLISVNIPSGVTTIGYDAFRGCSSLVRIEIPDSINLIGTGAFKEVPNISYKNMDGGSSWGAKCVNGHAEGCLVYSDVTKTTLVACATSAAGEIELPDCITKIGDRAFEGCRHITRITIPEGVCDIGIKAFCSCDALTEISLPHSVNGIGLWAFDDCTNLNKIHVPQGEYTRFCKFYELANFTDKICEIADRKIESTLQRDIQEQAQIQEQQLQEMLQNSILFFDTETTGTPRNYKAPVSDSYNWPRLVQLAWIMADKEGNILKRKSAIVKPEGFSIPADAVAVHGITTERAQQEGLPLREVLEEFVNDFSLAENTVGHNIEFDKNIVGAELCRLDMDYNQLMDKPSTCTMLSSTDYCAIPNPKGYFGYKWPSLQELYYKLFNRNFNDAHDALADITATKECFFELKKRRII